MLQRAALLLRRIVGVGLLSPSCHVLSRAAERPQWATDQLHPTITRTQEGRLGAAATGPASSTWRARYRHTAFIERAEETSRVLEDEQGRQRADLDLVLDDIESSLNLDDEDYS
jgi:hypothetical protein